MTGEEQGSPETPLERFQAGKKKLDDVSDFLSTCLGIDKEAALAGLRLHERETLARDLFIACLPTSNDYHAEASAAFACADAFLAERDRQREGKPADPELTGSDVRVARSDLAYIREKLVLGMHGRAELTSDIGLLQDALARLDKVSR